MPTTRPSTIEAVDVLGPLLDRWLRQAAWPQLWTSLRITAELLDAHDRPDTALLLWRPRQPPRPRQH